MINRRDPAYRRNHRKVRKQYEELHGAIPKGWHLHHIVPLSEGGEDCVDNVVALSPEDHAKVHIDRGDHYNKTAGIFIMASAGRKWDDDEWRAYHAKQTSIATKKGISEKDTPEARSARQKKCWEDPERRKAGVAASTGENNPRALLTTDDVLVIKYQMLSEGMTPAEIAPLFGVGKHVIIFIEKGRNWKHI